MNYLYNLRKIIQFEKRHVSVGAITGHRVKAKSLSTLTSRLKTVCPQLYEGMGAGNPCEKNGSICIYLTPSHDVFTIKVTVYDNQHFMQIVNNFHYLSHFHFLDFLFDDQSFVGKTCNVLTHHALVAIGYR